MNEKYLKPRYLTLSKLPPRAPPTSSYYCERCDKMYRSRNNKCPKCYKSSIKLRSSMPLKKIAAKKVTKAKISRKTHVIFEAILGDVMQDLVEKSIIVADHSKKKLVRESDIDFVLKI